MDVCLLHQYEEELANYKKEEGDETLVLLGNLERKIFETSLQVKKLLHVTHESTGVNNSAPSDSHGTGVKLPKIDVPTFD